MKSSVLKRILALAMCVMMLCSTMNVGVFAAEAASPVDIILPAAAEISVAEEIPAEEAAPVEEAAPAEEVPSADGDTAAGLVPEAPIVGGGTSSDTGSDSDIEITEELFPDDNLCAYVLSPDVDSDQNGWLSEGEIAGVEYLFIDDCGIADLTGLEIFTGITYLSLSNNGFTALDASLFPNLGYLNCSYCPNLASLNLLGCAKLTGIECQYTALTALDISECPDLFWLSCYGTEITELNLTDCPALAEAAGSVPEVTDYGYGYTGENGSLYCDGDVTLICPESGLPEPSQSLKIESDVFPDAIFQSYLKENFDYDQDGFLSTEEQEEVRYIDFTEHTDYNLLNSLKGIEYFPNLSTLICNNGGIDSLDLSANTKLGDVEIQNHNMTELNLTGLTNLSRLVCTGNKLTELDISDCTGLKELKCSSNHDLTHLDISRNPCLINAVEYGLEQTADGFRSFYNEIPLADPNILWIDSDVLISGAVAAKSGVAITEVNFPDDAFRTLVENSYDHNPKNGWLSSKEAAEVTTMFVGSSVADCTGIEHFTELTSLECSRSQNTFLDLSANTKLTYLCLSSCSKLTALNISSCTDLKTLILMGCPVAALDVSGFTSLTRLNCTGNYYIGEMESSLTSLNAAGCTALEELRAEDNAITALDVSGCTALKELDVSGNKLGTLDVSDCTALEILDCGYAGLTAIDVTMLPNLRELDCGRNYEITELDISQNPLLEDLHCDKNKLTALDVVGYSALEYLCCNDNAIQSLDLSGCTALRSALVYNNAFRTLDIGDCPDLVYAVENGVIDGTAGDVSSDIQFDADGENGSISLVLDEEVDILGAEMPAGCLISAYRFPDSGFRSSVVDALQEYSGKSISRYDFALFSDFEKVLELRCGRSDTESLEGLSYFPNLESLHVYADGVTEVDLSLVPNLTTLNVSGSGITELDLSLVPNLTALHIPHTGIESLDLAAVPGLVRLDCAMSGIETLDLTGNMTLWNSLVGIHPSELGYELEDGSVVEVFEYYNNGDLVLACNQDTVIIPKLEDPELVDMFPDATFRAYMREQFDADEDGMLSDEELNDVTAIDCSGLGIESMEGLWYLINLERLNCSDNDLTELNVENCGKMTVLDCSDNGISSLYLRNQAFEELYLSANPLTSMQLSSAGTLRVLDIHDTDMTSLSIHGYEALEELNIRGTGISHLDMEDCGGLRQLDCSDTAVEYLSLPGGGPLSWLVYNVEPTTENGVTTYRTTDTDGDVWLIYDEDVYLAGSDEEPEEPDVGGDYDTTEDLSGINQNVDVPLTAEYFPDANFREHVAQFDANGDGKLSYAERAEVFSIWCSFENVRSVRGVEYFPELIELSCVGNQLTYLNLTANTNLVFLTCEENRLTGMNLAGLADLQCIYASGNYDLTALDISDSAMLMDLMLAGCGIEELDITGCPELQMIDVSYTSLAELDTSENPNLTHVWVSGTGISQLDLEGKTDLTGLYISETNIPMPDIRQFPNLKFLYCGGLGITELPLEYVPKLTSLSCPNNELTELNLSAVPELAMLDCSNNRLTELDVSALPNLADLWCCGNNIAALDIRNNPSLCMIYHDGDAYVGEDVQEYSLIADGTMWTLSADGSTVITAANAPESDGVVLSEENFPDPAFLEYVAAYYDGNGDGVLSAAECYFVEEMSLEGDMFTDLTGIEYFTELRVLYCYETGVTELDISANNKLEEVELQSNPLETLTVGRQDSLLSLAVIDASLTELNVSGCPALMVLGVVDTPVEKVDISNCSVIAEIVNNTEPLEYDGYLLWVSPDGDRGMTVDAGMEIISSRDDLTEDGAMNEEDIEVIIRHIFQLDTTLTESEELFAVADVTEDDVVDTRDATQILRHASGLPSKFDP